MKKKMISCDLRIAFICLIAHFFLFFLSNVELLETAISQVNSQLEYWFYQALLVVLFLVYITVVIMFSVVLKRIQYSKIKYLLLLASIILPVPFCLATGNFQSKAMSKVAVWYGVKIYKYFSLWIIVVLSISAIVFIASLVRKKLKKRSEDNESH